MRIVFIVIDSSKLHTYALEPILGLISSILNHPWRQMERQSSLHLKLLLVQVVLVLMLVPRQQLRFFWPITFGIVKIAAITLIAWWPNTAIAFTN